MGRGIRYTMYNLGDIFVDKLESMWNSTKISTKGIRLTHNIRKLRSIKEEQERKLSGRVLELRESYPELEIFKDDELSKLFSEIDAINRELDSYIEERDEILYPTGRSVCSQCA
ncbi:conserved hypothetical protein. Homolog to OMM_8 MMP, 130034 of BW-1 and DMR_40930 of RS-1 [Desulfamplus magnetovallimortis]|uniref:Uncharacterized protein n=1 Tax=Desulfamplus magnetovallimortis TaxID=1246637 RepID=L0R564_9BACT|nr:hypothetical protein [Desulfamplus magnetovallimortis]CCO06692.1 conserved hypothetical protein. Homolog to OMM_8 MMP, 130034 of BW-1 and DMR_40930 of RS-1 [Desulfamplus magnetovallimortis BW-1]SLM32743.1 conserved hypothetical protein. Homolog to OMM_8 MMP, 130034 of BW-1 and DMR_40930 of RS-1 [Desulfamplus magnetovallimortis]